MAAKLALAISAGKETSLVAPFLKVDQVRALEGRLGKDHGFLAFLGSTEEVKSLLERAEPDELIALEVLLAEAVLDHLTVELFHAADQVVLEPEVRQ